MRYTSPSCPLLSSLVCRLFVDLKRLSNPALKAHLQLDSPSKPELSIQTFPYESVYTELQAVCAALGPKDKVWICDKASCALTQVIPKVRRRRLARPPSLDLVVFNTKIFAWGLFYSQFLKSINRCVFLMCHPRLPL